MSKKENHIDSEVFGDLTNMLSAKLPEFLDTYIESMDACVKAVRDAFAQKDLEALASAAHPMRATSGFLGAKKLSALAESLEEEALVLIKKDEQGAESLVIVFEELSREYSAVKSIVMAENDVIREQKNKL